MSFAAIIDYGMCNLDSVSRAVEECGGEPLVTDNPRDLGEATHIILPGVGAFPDAMENLRQTGFAEAIQAQVRSGEVPFLGICLGMQLMADKSYEVEETPGLGLIPGEVRRFKSQKPDERIPHIGWNEVVPREGCPLFNDIPSGKDFYFVHSYHYDCAPEYVLATTPYCGEFVSVVGSGQAYGTQFHPEKSQRLGFAVLRNFLAL